MWECVRTFLCALHLWHGELLCRHAPSAHSACRWTSDCCVCSSTYVKNGRDFNITYAVRRACVRACVWLQPVLRLLSFCPALKVPPCCSCRAAPCPASCPRTRRPSLVSLWRFVFARRAVLLPCGTTYHRVTCCDPQKQVFAEVTDVTGLGPAYGIGKFDGILGMAWPTISVDNVPTFFQNLVAEKAVDAPVFGEPSALPYFVAGGRVAQSHDANAFLAVQRSTCPRCLAALAS
jgi:hypothetical protein